MAPPAGEPVERNRALRKLCEATPALRAGIRVENPVQPEHWLNYLIFPLVCRSEGWTPAVDIPIWQRWYTILEQRK
jgi:hypothetical protein